KRLAFLGQISFSAYLLHYPLQCVMRKAAGWLGVSASAFYSPWALLLLFALLIPLSTLCFRFFEMPAQRALRARMLRQPSVSVPTFSVATERVAPEGSSSSAG